MYYSRNTHVYAIFSTDAYKWNYFQLPAKWKLGCTSKILYDTNNLATAPIFMMVHGLLSYCQHSIHCHLFQVKDMPPSVTKKVLALYKHRCSHNCVLLMVIGTITTQKDFVLLELSK